MPERKKHSSTSANDRSRATIIGARVSLVDWVEWVRDIRCVQDPEEIAEIICPTRCRVHLTLFRSPDLEASGELRKHSTALAGEALQLVQLVLVPAHEHPDGRPALDSGQRRVLDREYA